MQVPVKGSFYPWCPEVIIFTSNIHPDTWYGDLCEATRAAVKRRISSVRVFTNDDESV